MKLWPGDVHQQIGLLCHADVADFEIGAAVTLTREHPLVSGDETSVVTNALQRHGRARSLKLCSHNLSKVQSQIWYYSSNPYSGWGPTHFKFLRTRDGRRANWHEVRRGWGRGAGDCLAPDAWARNVGVGCGCGAGDDTQ
jgi:hypothetical protein